MRRTQLLVGVAIAAMVAFIVGTLLLSAWHQGGEPEPTPLAVAPIPGDFVLPTSLRNAAGAAISCKASESLATASNTGRAADLGSAQYVSQLSMWITLPEGYEIAAAPHPLVVAGSQAYDIVARQRTASEYLISIWAYAPDFAWIDTPGATPETGIAGVRASEGGDVLRDRGTPSPITIDRRHAIEVFRASDCVGLGLHERIAYITLDDGRIVRIAIDGGSDGDQAATFNAILGTVSFANP